ncbi:coiled-coil domain-containing protein 171-like isoform X1 [Orbicella faveolata]|uniref:coiled-coil domain-containing protein 171-like isoform X1 n=1 Tax=Orbicella faveolata TaxID=48498 RepID=UPI0009E1ABF1|nr:coiled-coil domain-containing protein 171-like isoform X1 [Orbicella faveolata]
MATSDWSSTYTEGGRSASASISPIPVSTGSPPDSGNSSPNSPAFAQDSIEQADEMDVVPRNNDQVAEYENEIRELRWQLQRLQEAGNLMDYTDSNELRRKLAQGEEEQADKIREFNEEIMGLQGQVAKLRSTVEKGEANRQKLEYDLTIANRVANQEKRAAAERESALQKTNASLKENITQLKKQLQNVEEALEATRQSSKNEEHKSNQLLAEKENMILQLTNQLQIEGEEKRKLHVVIEEQESLYAELQEKCSSLETQRSSQGETLQKQQRDLEFYSEKEERLKKEIEQYQERIKSLEESIEAERAAHLETKFNSEIIQLRVRDLEGALEVEKSAVDEAKHNLDTLTKQHRELETAFEEERDTCKAEKSKVASLEESLSTERKKLQEEIDEKLKIITDLSKQLEVHQKNFDALKSELGQAKKRQIQLDTTYGSSMRELELLLDNFQIEKPAEHKRQGHKKEKQKALSPAAVLENLRHTLVDYQNRCSNASVELKRMREVVEKLSADCEHYREMVTSREKAMKEAENAVASKVKELAKSRTECAEKEATIAAMKIDIQTLNKAIEDAKNKVQNSEEENIKVKSVLNREDETHRMFLHSLYQRMITGQVYVSSPDSSALSRYSWSDMCNLVSEQLSAQLSELNRANERIQHLESVLLSKEESLRHAQEAHEQTVTKLSTAIKDREVSWKKQKSEIEEHYSNLIKDLHTRTQKTQSLADQAWERVQETGQVKDTLEMENARLQLSLEQSQRSESSLLTVCALLAGALWPAFGRIRALASQRKILSEYSRTLESLRDQSNTLGEMLSNEMEGEKREKDESRTAKKQLLRDGRSPVLVFRVGVIAVIAANRLRYFGSCSLKLFVSSESPGEFSGMSTVCCGKTSKKTADFKGLAGGHTRESISGDTSRASVRVTSAQAWFTSSQLRSHLTSAVSELQSALNRMNEAWDGDSGRDDRDGGSRALSPSSGNSIIAAARNAYSKIISGLQTEFSGRVIGEEAWHERYSGFRGELMALLGLGLQQWLSKGPSTGLAYISSQRTISALQNHILGFTQRLHSAEVDRRSLRLELSKSKQETSELKSAQSSADSQHRKAKEEARGLEERLQEMKEEMLSMVPVARFENICEELNNALKREQQAQALLNEQTAQMQEMGERLELHTNQGEEKDVTLAEAVKGLTEAKMELRRKEHAVRQVSKQMTYMENEKNALVDRLNDAEKTMTAAAREKEALMGYLKSVDRALEQSKDQVRLSKGALGPYEQSLPQIILPDERLAMDGLSLSPELLSCQHVVTSFIECQQQALDRISELEVDKQQAMSRVAHLEEEIMSHKAHIATLKNELAAACRRPMSDDGLSDHGHYIPGAEGYPGKDASLHRFSEYRDDDNLKSFIPLSAHRDSSASFRPSLASTSGHPDRSKGSYGSPKRRLTSSYRKQGKQLGQDFSKLLDQGL